MSNSTKKAKECYLLTFGLLKATKISGRCEVCHSWPTSIKRKPKVLKKPTVQDRADDRSPKIYKIIPGDISMQKQLYVCWIGHLWINVCLS